MNHVIDKRPEPTKAYSDMTDEELLLEMETRRYKRDGQVELILIFAAKRMRELLRPKINDGKRNYE